MRVTDEMVDAAYEEARRYDCFSIFNEVAVKNMLRRWIEAALSHAAGQEVVAWMYAYKDPDGVPQVDMSPVRFLQSWVDNKHAIETPLYLHPTVARSEGEDGNG